MRGVTRTATLQDEIISFLKRYSGRSEIGLEQSLAKDVGFRREDGLYVLYELEEEFGIDLDPLVKAHTTYLPPNWWDRLRGRDRGPPVADVTVQQLVDYIARQRNNDALG
jgi:hypothetical protein